MKSIIKKYVSRILNDYDIIFPNLSSRFTYMGDIPKLIVCEVTQREKTMSPIKDIVTTCMHIVNYIDFMKSCKSQSYGDGNSQYRYNIECARALLTRIYSTFKEYHIESLVNEEIRKEKEKLERRRQAEREKQKLKDEYNKLSLEEKRERRRQAEEERLERRRQEKENYRIAQEKFRIEVEAKLEQFLDNLPPENNKYSYIGHCNIDNINDAYDEYCRHGDYIDCENDAEYGNCLYEGTHPIINCCSQSKWYVDAYENLDDFDDVDELANLLISIDPGRYAIRKHARLAAEEIIEGLMF